MLLHGCVVQDGLAEAVQQRAPARRVAQQSFCLQKARALKSQDWHVRRACICQIFWVRSSVPQPGGWAGQPLCLQNARALKCQPGM